MNKILLFLLIIIIGAALSKSASPVTKTDFDCTLRALKVCGNDDSKKTQNCLKRFVKNCDNNPGILTQKINHQNHHTYKTSIIVKKSASEDLNEQKRICITDSNCNCKTIAKNKCANDEDFDACVGRTQQNCQDRCQQSRRCYRLDCKNAGKSRCTTNSKLECAIQHPDSAEKRDACTQKKTSHCLRFERGTCRRARRVYNFRKSCEVETKAKCGAIFDKDTKCACVSQTRHACLVKKVERNRQTVRRVFDCEEASKIICAEKTCDQYKQCIQREKSICEPVCEKESRQKCNNQSNGPCYSQAYKTCIKKWKKTFCKKRAHIKCQDDQVCLTNKLQECKDDLPACFTGAESCDDKNKCTKDVCDPVQGCINTPINCDDNNACTTESCDPVLGCVYKTKNCDDGKTCTKDSCDPVSGKCKNIFDKNFCHVCGGGPCKIDSDCSAYEKAQNLASVCQTAYCDATTGSCLPKKKKLCADVCKRTCIPNNPCDDAQCTLDKASGKFKCVHSDKKCDDGKTCTKDSCDPVLGCVHKVDTTLCPNNPKCTVDTDCQEWSKSKKLNTKCQKAYCDHHKGICLTKTTSKECDTEVCEKNCQPAHACEFTKCIKNGDEKSICKRTPVICDDKKACTVDTCDKTRGCVFKYVVNDICHPGCQCAHTADCKDYEVREKLASQCLRAVCDPSLGACVKVPAGKECKIKRNECKTTCTKNDACDVAQCVEDKTGELVCKHKKLSCDDGIACTVDTCDPVLGCVNTYKADEINCPKGGKCKRDDDCIQWGFSNKLAKQCKKAVCDRSLGACRALPKTKDCVTSDECELNCRPANACETASCKLKPSGNFECQRVSKRCNDFDKCTLDTCDVNTGKCLHTPISNAECTPTTTNKCLKHSDCDKWALTQKLGECQVSRCDLNTFTCISKKSKSAKCNPTDCPNCVARNLCEKAKCVKDTTGNFNCVYSQKSCDDGKSCTVDRCDVKIGCVNTYIPSDKCPADAPCQNNDGCQNWAVNHRLKSKCKIAECDLTLGRCVSKPSPNPNCVPSTECINCKPSSPCESASCVKNNDGSVSCVRTVNKCDDGKVCTVDTCDKTTGKCVNTYTVSQQCPPNGKCLKNLDCKQWALDNKIDTACLTPICHEKNGACTAVPNGFKCTKKTCEATCKPSDACQESTCAYDVNTKQLNCEYSRKVCNDNNKCTVDSCDKVQGCVFKFDKTITGCDTPICKSKADCVEWSTSKSLTDNCQEAVCDATTKTCKAILINNPKCNPFFNKCIKKCVAANACESANCVVDGVTKEYNCVRKARVCDDKNPCTTDVCDPVKGCIFTYVKTSTCEQPCKIDSDCATYGADKKASLKCQVAVCDKATTSCKLQADPNPNCTPIDLECKLVCKPKNACETAKCERKEGTNKLTCVRTSTKNQCNDNKECTVDTCDNKKGCVYTFKQSDKCVKPCDKDLDCVAWGVSKKLEDTCQKAVCDIKLGSCKAVKGPVTSKCKPVDQCVFSKDCPQAKFGTVCCAKGLNKECCDNECEADLDCVPKDKKTHWGYCRSRPNGKRECEYTPKCKANTDCDDKNPCTRDVCLRDYGFCKNLPRCVDNSCCTLDICVPGEDNKSYTCKNPVRSCTNDKTLLDKNYDLLSKDKKSAWLGKCSHTDCCVTCVVNAQCDDNNGCTEDSCVNQLCVNKPIDNKWCDPKLEGQAITVQGYFPKFTRL